jgi:hypothetical protein
MHTLIQHGQLEGASMMQSACRLAAIVTAALIAGSCASPASPDAPIGSIRVTGTVQHYMVEGGFWAVRGDDGVTYDPLGALPAALQREGLRVVMVAKTRNDLAGIHMVGPIVEIIEIHPV